MMDKSQSDKKNFYFPGNSQLLSQLPADFIKKYSDVFKVYRKDNTSTALNYFQGLIVCEKGKANMERIEEEISDTNYRAYQHFISNSKWDYKKLMKDLSFDASELLKTQKKDKRFPTGYIIDESATLKKGKSSVGVSKQYAGVVGKIENCQVGVYASLVNNNRALIINGKLFLSREWVDDIERCKKAGVPKSDIQYRTKPELALEMIDEDIKNGVVFDWIGGDGLYGHNYELSSGLDERGLFFVLDVHKDETIFLQEPDIVVPEMKNPKGRKPTVPQPNAQPIRLDQYLKTLKDIDWQTIKIRKTAKGWLKSKIHKVEVWVWNKEHKALKKRTLIISKTLDKRPKVKYSFSNGEIDEYSTVEYAYFQAQRYWVERTFQDAKNELGMSDYQVRKWISWYHHMSLVIMAGLYLTQEKIAKDTDVPLMSMTDARILMITTIFGTEQQQRMRIKQMIKRHKKRKDDIDRRYRYQDLNEFLK